MKTLKKHYLLTVTGEDTSGIIAGITGLLFKRRCNLEDISMTILEGQFSMMLVVETGTVSDWVMLGKDIQIYAKKSRLCIHWRELVKKLSRGETAAKNCTRYIVTAIGRDKTGIVYKISQILAGHRLNITDLNSKILGYGPHAIYTMMLEMDVPKKFNIKTIETPLKKLQRTLKIELQVKPSELISF
jgi:glycine cleavage system transcriptional repressor